jgi:hypothetical protein
MIDTVADAIAVPGGSADPWLQMRPRSPHWRSLTVSGQNLPASQQQQDQKQLRRATCDPLQLCSYMQPAAAVQWSEESHKNIYRAAVAALQLAAAHCLL